MKNLIKVQDKISDLKAKNIRLKKMAIDRNDEKTEPMLDGLTSQKKQAIDRKRVGLRKQIRISRY